MRIYKFSYTPSPTTGAQLLTQVQQFDRNATINPTTFDVTGLALPPVTMTYATSASTVTPSATPWLTGWCSGGSGITPADFNGDGRADLWCTNTANGFSTAVGSGPASFTGGSDVFSACTQRVSADFDGDGRSDLGCVSLQNVPAGQQFKLSVAYSTGAGSFSAPGPQWIICTVTSGSTIGASDLNGDGKTDLWCSGTVSTTFVTTGIFSLGTTFTQNPPTWLTGWCSGGAVSSSDFNGDGKADLVCHQSSGTTTLQYSTSQGTTTGTFTPSASLVNWCPLTTSRLGQYFPELLGTKKVSLADFNGDGLQDVWCHVQSDGTVKVALSTGTSLSLSATPWRTGFCTTGTPGIADLNGDGVTDLWCHTTDGTTQVMVSTGSTFQAPTPWGPSFCATGTFGAADLNGDAKPDFWCVNGGTVSVALAGSPGVKPDLLATVSNGLGASTALTYRPSTALGVTHTLLPYPIYVTTALTTTVTTALAGGIGAQSTQTTYQYEKGYHSISSRDFRGFQKVTVTACATCSPTAQTITVTEFHQGSGTGTAEDTGTTLTHPDAPTKGLPYRIVVQDSVLIPQFETLTTYTTDVDAVAPWYTPASQVVTKTYTNGVLAKTAQVNFTYDHTYGNVLREEYQGDTSVTGDEKTIDREFANEPTAWLIGFLTRDTMYKGISTALIDKMAETTFFYDGTTSCTTASTLQVPTLGHLTRTVNWLSGGTNPETWSAYDPYGNQVCTRDPRGTVTTITYDTTNQVFPQVVTKPLGVVTTTAYYGLNGIPTTNGLFGQVQMVTDPNNQTTTTTYDTFGRRITVVTPQASGTFTSTVAYPNWGQGVGTDPVTTQHVATSNTLGLSTWTFFDGAGRPITTKKTGPTGSGAIRVDTLYDLRGLVAQTSLPYVEGTGSALYQTTSYDVLGRVSQVTKPDGTVTTICRDGWTTTTLDPKQHRKTETADAYGRTIMVQEFTGTQQSCTGGGTALSATTQYQYDVRGNLVKVIDQLGNLTTMQYDSLSRKIAMSDPDMGKCGDLTTLAPSATYPWYPTPCWNYQYDDAGNLVRQTDAKNQTLWFTYDALNRRMQKDYTTQKPSGTGDVRYLYEPSVTTFNQVGRVTQVIDAAVSVTFRYDPVGRIVRTDKVLDGVTYVSESSYDGLGRVTQVKYPTTPVKAVDYVYNGPWLEKVLDTPGSGTVTYVTYAGWNALGQPGTTTHGNGVVTTRTFQPLTFRPDTVTTINPNTPSPDIAAPTVPTQLIATIVSGTQINLSWTASLDNVGVSGYRVERCQGAGCTTFAQVGTSIGQTFSDTGVTAGTLYSYRVRATDAAGNLSGYSIPTPTTGYGPSPYGLSPYGS
ncbi:MAG: FG-GAP-like repeat-containing protein [Nitrospira sp.]